MTIYLHILIVVAAWYSCLLGYGFLISIATNFKYSISYSLLAAWGMAVLILIGGVLNVLHWVSPLSLGILYGIGWLGACLYFYQAWKNNYFSSFFDNRNDLFNFITLLFLALIIVLIVKILSLVNFGFNPHDDLYAYVALPEQMLASGAMAEQPYSERRMTAYGGQTFLHAYALVLVPHGLLHALDSGLALSVFALLFWSHVQNAKSEHLFIGLLIAAVLIFIPNSLSAPTNITSQYTGIALIYSLLCCIKFFDNRNLLPTLIIVSINISALVALKHTYIPWMAMLFLCLPFAMNKQLTFIERYRILAIISVMALLMLTPWIYAMYASNQSILYPLLGLGTHGRTYGLFPLTSIHTEHLKTIIVQTINTLSYPMSIAGLCICLFLIYTRKLITQPIRLAIIAFILALVNTTIIGIIMIATPALDRSIGEAVRYAIPALLASFTYLLVESIKLYDSLKIKQNPAYISIGLVIVLASSLVIGSQWRDSYIDYYYQILQLKSPNPTKLSENKSRLRSLQKLVPEGASIFTRLDQPHNLDYSRNNIILNDWPCGSSPAPGMPCMEDPESLVDYLRNQNIRYIMYSYQNEANYSKRDYSTRLYPDSIGYMGRSHYWTVYTFWFQDTLLELSNSYDLLADNGHELLIDIGEK